MTNTRPSGKILESPPITPLGRVLMVVGVHYRELARRSMHDFRAPPILDNQKFRCYWCGPRHTTCTEHTHCVNKPRNLFDHQIMESITKR